MIPILDSKRQYASIGSEIEKVVCEVLRSGSYILGPNVKALEAENIPMASAEITMIPQTYVELTDENDIKYLQRTLDLLEDDDDVQQVYHNWNE